MRAIDRTKPPEPGASRPFHFPPFSRERLGNGLELILAPRTGMPLVEILLQLPAGAERNPLERPGLAALTASLVDEGTERRSGPEIATALERLGGSIATRADWNSADVQVSLLARELDAGLELVDEVARRPVFPEAELERLRQQALTELLRRRDQPAVLAEEAMADLLYRGTVYGRLLLGDEQVMARIDRADVVEFHQRWFRPDAGSLVIAGEFDAAATRSRIEEIFGSWRAAETAAPTAVDPVRREGRSVVIVDRPAAAQTELRIAQVGVPRTHPDRTLLGLLNALLGGKFTSRLNLNLRERHGYTYGASSRFVDRRSAGPFLVSAAVANAVAGAAVGEVISELERLRSEPVGADELAETQSYLTGVFPYTLQTSADLLSRLAELALWGLADDHYDRALARVAAARTEDLLELAERHLRPDSATIVAVGPAAELESQLAAYGPVEVRTI